MPYNLRPSASSIWTKCKANPRISETAKVQAQDSDAAREGTCAAWVAETVLKGTFSNCFEMVGMNHTNNWLVTDEMASFVQGYVDTIRGLGGTIYVEQFVRLNDYIAGTLDASVVSLDGTTLYVNDLKYGFKIVDVFENTQTIIYGCAELMRLNDPRITHVVLGIYQPRAWHPEGIYRTWRLTVQELYELAGKIAQAGEECQNPEAVATPGEHCGYCKGRLECVALAHSVYAFAEVLERREQGAMSREEIGKELDFLDRLKSLYDARYTAVHAEAMLRIERGEHVPGWGLKERRGHRKYKTDLLTVHVRTGISPFKLTERTPAEMEKAGADKKVMKELAFVPVVGHKLERITERDYARMFRDR